MSKDNYSDDSDLSLEQVIEKYYPVIYENNYYLLFKSKVNAQDVTQNVFTLLVEKWDELEKTHIRAWLFSVARLKLYEFYRSNKRISDHVVSLELLKDELPISNEIHDTYNIDDKTLEKIKEEVLDMLTDDERRLYEDYFVNGVSYDKLMKLYSISYSAVTTRVSRLKEKLNHCIGVKSASLLSFGFVYSTITLSLLYKLLGGR